MKWYRRPRRCFSIVGIIADVRDFERIARREYRSGLTDKIGDESIDFGRRPIRRDVHGMMSGEQSQDRMNR